MATVPKATVAEEDLSFTMIVDANVGHPLRVVALPLPVISLVR
jgi:hypothetical protein